MTKVAIVINNYNYGQYLRDAIDSALGQDQPAHRVIVVDDGSTDNSWDIIKGYGSAVTAIQQRNGGQLSAIAKGVDLAERSDVVALLDADDIASPRRVSALSEVFERHPAAGWAFHTLVHSTDPTRNTFEDESPLGVRYIDDRRYIRRGTSRYTAPATSGLSFRTSAIRSWMPFPASQGIWLSDNYLKFLAQGYHPGVHLSQPLGALRLHGENRYTASESISYMRAGISLATAHALLTAHPTLKRQAYALLKRSWGEQDALIELSELREELRGLLPKSKQYWFIARGSLASVKHRVSSRITWQ